MHPKWTKIPATLCLASTAMLLGLAGAPAHADPDVLWRIIDTQCVPNQIEHGKPAPCSLVNLDQGRERGFVVMKSTDGPLQYLLMPTAKVPGIESPRLLEANAPDYWGEAWEARRFMEKLYGAPILRDDVSLTINSAYGRSQNQLHIHVSCIDPAVRTAVDQFKDTLPTNRWSSLPVKLAGHDYQARRVDAAAGDRVPVNPFLLIADGIPQARTDMASETLGMVAASFADGREGFILLADRASKASGDPGHAEELQDHDCRILPPPRAAASGS